MVGGATARPTFERGGSADLVPHAVGELPPRFDAELSSLPDCFVESGSPWATKDDPHTGTSNSTIPNGWSGDPRTSTVTGLAQRAHFPRIRTPPCAPVTGSYGLPPIRSIRRSRVIP